MFAVELVVEMESPNVWMDVDNYVRFDVDSNVDLVIVVPLTTTRRAIPLHVQIDPPDGDVRETSFAMCEAVRSISSDRLEKAWGMVSQETMATVADRLRVVLDL